MEKLRISGTSTTASAVAGTVLIGPISLDGAMDLILASKTGAAGSTTATAAKIQFDLLGAGIWRDLASGTVTASATANALVHSATVTAYGSQVRVVAGGAFAAGDASLELFGITK